MSLVLREKVSARSVTVRDTVKKSKASQDQARKATRLSGVSMVPQSENKFLQEHPLLEIQHRKQL
jgi:hypothetical protein